MRTTIDSSHSFKDACVRVCVDKFANVNQRMMGTYVEVQGTINERRMKEYEEQLKQAEALAAQEQQNQLIEPAPVVEAAAN